MTALCLRYLHRHPLELTHLPAHAWLDLLAYAEFETAQLSQMEASTWELPLRG